MSKLVRLLATLLFFTVLAFAAIATEAQKAPSKLDGALSEIVRAKGAGRQRVIIRTTGNGAPGLRVALEASGNPVLLSHPLIDAVTTEVPVAALEGLSHNPFVESISIDA